MKNKEFKMNFFEKKVYREIKKEMQEYQKKWNESELFINDENTAYLELMLCCGYQVKRGYFMVYCERGIPSLYFQTKNKDELIVEWLKNNLSSWSFDKAIKNRKEHIKDWHYVAYYTTIDLEKLKSDDAITNYINKPDIENSVWKYDLKYDERKYAFEYELQALKKLGVNESVLSKTIEKYLYCLNKDLEKGNYWTFDKEKMEFVPLSNN